MNLSDVKDRVKEHADLGAIIAKYTKPVKTATGFKACCPLPGHKEKTPSFHYNQRGNYFFCYGCNRGGDVFKFLEIVEGLPFFDALKELAETLGIEIPKTVDKGVHQAGNSASGVQHQNKSQKELGFELLGKAKAFFSKILLDQLSPGATQGIEYLENRGISKQEVLNLGLGWSLESGDPLTKKLKTDVDFELARAVGLVRNYEGRKYDFFRNRLMIPVFDARGRTIGFSGRTLDEVTSKNPKYINSSESEWFKKKAVLYGLERAHKFIREENFVCVVEGFFDQWAFDRNEIPSVAVMGTALTLDHLGTLGRYTKNVVLVMDTDNAGIQSTKKSVVLLVEQGWSVRVFSAFEGKDPDEWLQKLSKEKNLKEKVRTHLLSAEEGLEWLAQKTIQECQKKNLSRGEIIQELGFVWSLSKQESQRLRVLDILSPITGFEVSDLRKALDEVRVAPSAKKEDDNQVPSQTVRPAMMGFKVPSSLIDRLAEQCYLWWVWHREYLWPKDDAVWAERKRLFSGTFLEPVVEKIYENREFWGEEAPEKVAEQFLAENNVEPILNSTLIKSLVRSDKGQTNEHDKASNSFREMSNLLSSEKVKNKIAFLKNEIRKNSHDSEKTAQLLHAVQELIQS